jgi:hypothetical protein
MLPQAPPKPLTFTQPFGEMLVAGILSDSSDGALPGTATCAHACTVLAALVRGNPAAQARAAQTQVEWHAGRLGAPKILSLPEVCLQQLGRAWGRSGGGPVLQTNASSGPPSREAVPTRQPSGTAAQWAVPAVLCLLVSLCDRCREAAGRVLQDSSHIPLLLEMMQGWGDATVAGLAALLCGCCLLVEGEDLGGKAALTDVLSNRIGIRGYFDTLERGLDSERMQVSQSYAFLQRFVWRELFI